MATVYSLLMVRAMPGTVRCSLGTSWLPDKAVAGHCFKHLWEELFSSTFSILELWLNCFYSCGVSQKLVLLLLPFLPFPNTFLLALSCTPVGWPIVLSLNCQASACPRHLGLWRYLPGKLSPGSAEASWHLCEHSPLTLVCFSFNTSLETLQIVVCHLFLGAFFYPGLPLRCESHEKWSGHAWPGGGDLVLLKFVVNTGVLQSHCFSYSPQQHRVRVL